jgi:serine/threonine-protein kinase
MGSMKDWIGGHKNLILGIGSTLLTLIVLVFIMDWIVMPLYTHHGVEEELPDVTEMSFREAKGFLESRGFSIVIDGMKFDETYPESTVVFQSPTPYSQVKKNRRIYVTLSAGERLLSVPSVVGLSERDAAFRLRQAGLVLGEVFYEYHNYHLAGVVFGQSIDPTVEVAVETPVDITVSMGRSPERFVVPDVVGKSMEEAKKVIRQAGLQVGQVDYEVHPNLVPETVIQQSLPPAQEVARGTMVDLIVSRLEEADWEER